MYIYIYMYLGKEKEIPKENNSTASWDLFVQQVGRQFRIRGTKAL